tara:strand:- start:1851 stop:2261 length:411 start_codon:yes stop_codon:yes gene_type:complete
MKTKTIKTYWSDNGKHEKKYNLLWDEFVPPRGECKELAAEVFRMAGRLYYDVYNNGACNIERQEDEDFTIAGQSLGILKYAIDDGEYYEIRWLTFRFAEEYADYDQSYEEIRQPLEAILDKVIVWAWDKLKGESTD